MLKLAGSDEQGAAELLNYFYFFFTYLNCYFYLDEETAQTNA